MRRSDRKYTGVLQFFHNYEHDKEGRTHCTGPPSNPWTIEMLGERHVISSQYAMGHGRGHTQWFKFTEKAPGGWFMKSGQRIDRTEVPERFMRSSKRKKKGLL